MKRYSQDEINTILTLYKEGLSIREITRRTGVARGTLSKWLEQYEIRKPIRNRETVSNFLKKEGFTTKLSEADKELIKIRYKEGNSQREIATELGVSPSSVNYYFKKWDFTVKYNETRQSEYGIEKKCTKCNKWKLIDQFTKIIGRGKEYYLNSCSKCQYEYHKTSYGRDMYASWASNLNRNTKRQGATGRLRKKDFEIIGHWKDNVCHICKCGFHEEDIKPLPSNSKNSNDWKPQLDHIVPFIEGGENTVENIAWSHRYCNGHFKRGYKIEDLLEFCYNFIKHHKEEA